MGYWAKSCMASYSGNWSPRVNLDYRHKEARYVQQMPNIVAKTSSGKPRRLAWQALLEQA